MIEVSFSPTLCSPPQSSSSSPSSSGCFFWQSGEDLLVYSWSPFEDWHQIHQKPSSWIKDNQLQVPPWRGMSWNGSYCKLKYLSGMSCPQPPLLLPSHHAKMFRKIHTNIDCNFWWPAHVATQLIIFWFWPFQSRRGCFKISKWGSYRMAAVYGMQ